MAVLASFRPIYAVFRELGYGHNYDSAISAFRRPADGAQLLTDSLQFRDTSRDRIWSAYSGEIFCWPFNQNRQDDTDSGGHLAVCRRLP